MDERLGSSKMSQEKPKSSKEELEYASTPERKNRCAIRMATSEAVGRLGDQMDSLFFDAISF